MKKTAILMLSMLFCSHTYGELIESALINLNGTSIALWGDRHTHRGSDTDAQQLEALETALRNRPGNRPLHLIVEETSSLTKMQNFRNKHILSDARNVVHKYPHYKPLSTENIEMRGKALASALILQHPKQPGYGNWHYMNFNYDDAHGVYPLRDMTIKKLRGAFLVLRKKCLKITRNKKDQFGQPLWHSKLEEADADFRRVETTIRAYTSTLFPQKEAKNMKKKKLHRRQIRNAVSIYQLKNKIDPQIAHNLAGNIINAFSSLFDIILADRVLSLADQGSDVAICAGVCHTRDILWMISAARPHARTAFRIHQSLDDYAIPLTDRDINVFEQSKPWWQNNRAYTWCASLIPDLSFCYA